MHTQELVTAFNIFEQTTWSHFFVLSPQSRCVIYLTIQCRYENFATSGNIPIIIGNIKQTTSRKSWKECASTNVPYAAWNRGKNGSRKNTIMWRTLYTNTSTWKLELDLYTLASITYMTPRSPRHPHRHDDYTHTNNLSEYYMFTRQGPIQMNTIIACVDVIDGGTSCSIW